MKRVNILLAVWNGEKYLRQQLDSLLCQTYKNVHITVRDDGSEDESLEILREYQRKIGDERLKIISYGGKRLGYPDCFWYLLYKTEPADYYAFCDQDDIWAPEKLDCAVRELAKENEDIPLLYAHDYELCTADLKNIGRNLYPDYNHMPGRKLIFYSYIQGFSMVINDNMRQRLLRQRLPGKNISHDLWTVWNAFYAGKILHDPHILAKYRRHEGTATPTGSGRIAMIRTLWYKEILGDEYVNLCRMAAYFVHVCGTEMPAKDRREWLLLSYRKKSVMAYIIRVFYPFRLRPSLAGDFVLRLLFMTGR